jgi:hypothetical protein
VGVVGVPVALVVSVVVRRGGGMVPDVDRPLVKIPSLMLYW